MSVELFTTLRSKTFPSLEWKKKSLSDICWDQSNLDKVPQELENNGIPQAINLFMDDPVSDFGEQYSASSSREDIGKNALDILIQEAKNSTPTLLDSPATELLATQVMATFLQLDSLRISLGKPESRKKPQKNKTKKDSLGPLPSMAIKTGLAFFYTMLNRCTMIAGAECILTDMLSAMNSILLEFEPLSLYHNAPSKIGTDSLNQASSFMFTKMDETSSQEIKDLCLTFLVNLALQRGSVSSIIPLFLYLRSRENENQKLSKFQPLINILMETRDATFDSFHALLPKKKSSEEAEVVGLEETHAEVVVRSDDSDNSVTELSLDDGEYPKSEIVDHDLSEFDKNEHIEKLYSQVEENEEVSLSVLVRLFQLLLEDISRATMFALPQINSDESQVFGWGKNKHNQLGAQEGENNELLDFEKLSPKQVGGGYKCAFVLTTNGEVYGIGKNSSYALGIGDTDSTSTFVQLEIPGNVAKIAVQAGDYCHGLAVTSDHKVYSWGAETNYRLGGDYDDHEKPELVGGLEDVQVIDIAVSSSHSVALTSDGSVYHWGYPVYETFSKPTKVVGLQDIVYISCTSSSGTFAVDQEGNVFFYGDEHYSLFNDPKTITTPLKLETLSDLGVAQIVSTRENGMVLTKSGVVYSFGTMGGTIENPKEIENLPACQFLSIVNYWCGAVSTSGDVYLWAPGDNPNKQEGVTGMRQISCGHGFTIACSTLSPQFGTSSMIKSLKQNPFVLELTPQSIRHLETMLKQYGDIEANPKPEQAEYLQFVLTLLRSNLYHLQSNMSHCNIEEFDFSYIKEYLFTLLDLQQISAENKATSRAIIEESWKLLVPSNEQQTEVLFSLLPENKEEMKNFSETKMFLLKVIALELVNKESLAQVFSTYATETQIEIFSKIVNFINFLVIKVVSLNDLQHVDFNVLDTLQTLLNYFVQRALVDILFQESCKETNLDFISIIFKSWCELMRSLTTLKDLNEEILRKTYLYSLYPYTISAMFFFSDANLEPLMTPLEELIDLLDKVIRLSLETEIPSIEAFEFAGENRDSLPFPQGNWLIHLERMNTALLGEFYAKRVYPSDRKKDEYFKLFGTDLFQHGFISIEDNRTDDETHECLEELVSKQSGLLYTCIFRTAKKKLLIRTEEYPPLKHLVCTLAATMIKATGQVQTAINISRGLKPNLPASFTNLISDIYLYREQLLKSIDLSDSEDPNEVKAKQCEDLEKICEPVIERALFLFRHIGTISSKSLADELKAQMMDEPIMDLRASVPSMLQSKEECLPIRKLKDSLDSKSRTKSSRVIGISRKLKKFTLQADKHITGPLVKQILEFVKSDISLDKIKEIGHSQTKLAGTRHIAVEKLLHALSKSSEWIPSARLSFLRTSFQLLFKYNTKLSLVRDIPLAKKILREEIFQMYSQISSVLIQEFIDCASQLEDKNYQMQDVRTLQILLRSLICQTMKENASPFVNDKFLDMIFILFKHELDRTKDFIFNSGELVDLAIIIFCSVVYSDGRSHLTQIMEFVFKFISALHKYAAQVDQFLEVLRISTFSKPLCEIFTSEKWLTLIVDIVERGHDPLERLSAVRLLKQVLPHLNPQHMQQYSSLTRQFFDFLHTLPFEPNLRYLVEPEESYELCEITTECCEINETENTKIITMSPSDGKDAEFVIQVPQSENIKCFSVTLYVDECDPNASAAFWIGDDFIDVAQLDVDDPEICFQLYLIDGFFCGRVDCVDVLDHFSRPEPKMQNIRITSTNRCIFTLSRCQTSDCVKYKADSLVATNQIALKQEIVELLYSLSTNEDWYLFIQSFIKDAPVKIDEPWRLLSAAKMIGGIHAGLRLTGSAVSKGSEGIVFLGDDYYFCSKDSSTDKSLQDTEAIIADSCDFNRLPIEDDFLVSLCQLNKKIQENSTLEEMSIANVAGKALARLCKEPQHQERMLSKSMSTFVDELISIAAEESPMKRKFTLAQYDRVICNLATAIRIEDFDHSSMVQRDLVMPQRTNKFNNMNDSDSGPDAVYSGGEDDSDQLAQEGNMEEAPIGDGSSDENHTIDGSCDEYDETPIVEDSCDEYYEAMDEGPSNDSEDERPSSENCVMHEEGYDEVSSEYDSFDEGGGGSIDCNTDSYESDSNCYSTSSSEDSSSEESSSEYQEFSEAEFFLEYFALRSSSENPPLEDLESQLLSLYSEGNTSWSRISLAVGDNVQPTTRDITTFAKNLNNLPLNTKRTVLYLLEKGLQIERAQAAVMEMLMSFAWKITDPKKIQELIFVFSQVYKPENKDQGVRMLNKLRQVDANVLQEAIQACFTRYVDEYTQYDDAVDKIQFPALQFILENSLEIISAEEWKETVLNWMALIAFVDKFPREARVGACRAIAVQCAKAKKLVAASKPFAKLFYDSFPANLKLQKKQESLDNVDESSPIKYLAAIAFVMHNDLERNLSDDNAWLDNYFLTLDTTNAIRNGEPIPRPLTKRAIPELDDQSDLKPYEDNTRWTPSMDEKLNDWVNRYASEWRCENVVYVCGEGDHLSLGQNEYGTSTPVQSELLTQLNPCAIAVGYACVFALTELGAVFAIGSKSYPQIGFSDGDSYGTQFEPKELDFKGASIKKLVASHDYYGFCIALDSEGRVYAWGSGENGVLGRGESTSSIATPALIPALEDETFIDIACVDSRATAISQGGELYIWGCFNYESKKPVVYPFLQNICAVAPLSAGTYASTDNGKKLWKITELDEEPESILWNGAAITKMKSTGSCCFILAADGKLYVVGFGSDGILGLGEKTEVELPEQVHMYGQSVVDFAVGGNIVLAATKNGSVFGWGYMYLQGEYKEYQHVPIEISFPEKITNVAASSSVYYAFRRITDVSKLLPEKLPKEYSMLQPLFTTEMVYRRKIFHIFSQILCNSLPLLNLEDDVLSFGIQNEMWRLSQLDKDHILKSYLRKSSCGSSKDIKINRFRADHAPEKYSVFLQIFHQLESVSPKRLQTERAWCVQLEGEGSIDQGGPYNESLSTIFQEINDNKVSIICATPNRVNHTGDYQNCVFPCSQPGNDEQFIFFGRLCGISLRSNSPLTFELPPCFWELLQGASMTRDHLIQVDESFVVSHEYLLQFDKDDEIEDIFDSIPREKFPTVVMDRKKIRLTPITMKEYVDAAFASKMEIYQNHLSKIRSGLGDIVSLSILKLFSPKELHKVFCGSPKFDWKKLKKKTRYSGAKSDDAIIQWFWEVVESMDNEDSSRFLRFVWGKSRLPAEFSDTFEIGVDGASTKDLPSGTTCSFMLHLPRYPTKELLEEKLLYAIRNCATIDTDNEHHDSYTLD